MFRRILLGCLLASASATTAMANGYYFHNSYFNYSAPQHNAYRGGGYGHGYAGAGGYGAPVVYYRVPIYVIPARRVRTHVAAPCGCEATSSATTVAPTMVPMQTPEAAPNPASVAKPPEPEKAAAPTPQPATTDAKTE